MFTRRLMHVLERVIDSHTEGEEKQAAPEA